MSPGLNETLRPNLKLLLTSGRGSKRPKEGPLAGRDDAADETIGIRFGQGLREALESKRAIGVVAPLMLTLR